MAATLIYIKSKMLLPPDPLAAPENRKIPRAELVHRLVEHEKFKNAAQLLHQKQQIEEHVWSKPDLSLYNGEDTEGELIVSLVDLVKVFQKVLERRKEVVEDRAAPRTIHRRADDAIAARNFASEEQRSADHSLNPARRATP